MAQHVSLDAATQHYREAGAGIRPYERARCDDSGIQAIAQAKVYQLLQRGILSGRVTRPDPRHYVVSQAVYDGIVDLGAEPLLPHINLVITVRAHRLPGLRRGDRVRPEPRVAADQGSKEHEMTDTSKVQQKTAAERPEEIPCGYNGGRPCDYTGRGGKGYCEGCCRCPW